MSDEKIRRTRHVTGLAALWGWFAGLGDKGLIAEKARRGTQKRKYRKFHTTNNHGKGESKTRRLMAKESRRINRKKDW